MRRVLHIIDSLDRTDAAHQLRVLAQGLARDGVRGSNRIAGRDQKSPAS